MTRYVAGNWKMNHGPAATERFLREFTVLAGEGPAAGASAPGGPTGGVRASPTLIVFPPALSLAAARGALPGTPAIALGVQNVHAENAGAFTGELSAEMAAEAGARYALVGHSERRHLFGERDEDTRRKVAAAQRAGLAPILCVGERIEERRAGRLEEVLLRQLDAVFGEAAIADRVVGGAPFLLAYEPVWAIGTGETATPADATEAHGILRESLTARIGADRARAVPVLYGGSVTPENAAGLLAAPEVEGVLVGGASLRPDSFLAIARAAAAS